MRKVISSFIMLLMMYIAESQQCSNTGQTPATAFIICGADTFNQQTLAQCTNLPIPAGRCGTYTISNAFWNRFECFQTGSLGFLITPKYDVSHQNLGDDYNWELFDITGHAPDDVYSNPSLLISSNWSGTYGVTGTSVNAADTIQCSSNNNDRTSPYSIMPIVQQKHTYLLLVIHQTQIESSYQLSFNSGTASITPSVYALQAAQSQCNGSFISIKTSSAVKCNSIAADGSDFSISSSVSRIISASGAPCDNNFSDSIILKLNNSLSPGNYIITAKTGSDGNTLILTDCNKRL